MNHVIKLFAIVALMAITVTVTTSAASAPLEPLSTKQNSIAAGSLNAAFSSWGNSSLQGDWKIVADGDSRYIELSDNFTAKAGPDVRIFLSPIAASHVTGGNATKGSVFIQRISKFSGQSRIKIPNGTDLSQYKSLVFHCEEFSRLWGSSPLQTIDFVASN